MRERRKVEVKVELPPESPVVVADRGAVADALLNSADERLQIRRRSPGHHGESRESIQHAARISVSDNGPGIAPSEHKRIFQKFYRVDDRLSREQEGSGLGLAIVKHVMRAHRGKVELVSEPGKGSTFFCFCLARWPNARA